MKMNNAKIEGVQGWLNRDNMPGDVDLEADHLKVGRDGVSASGNDSSGSAGLMQHDRTKHERNTSNDTPTSS